MRPLSVSTSLTFSILIHLLVLFCFILASLILPTTQHFKELSSPSQDDSEVLMIEEDDSMLELIPRTGELVELPELEVTPEVVEQKEGEMDSASEARMTIKETEMTSEEIEMTSEDAKTTAKQTAKASHKNIFAMTQQFVHNAVQQQTALSVERLRSKQIKQHVKQLTHYSYKDRLLLHATYAWQRFQMHNQGRYIHLHPPRSVNFDFSINQDGSIHSFTILSSSGCTTFDEIVRRFIYEEAAPFPPIPAHLGTTVYSPQLGCTFYLHR